MSNDLQRRRHACQEMLDRPAPTTCAGLFAISRFAGTGALGRVDGALDGAGQFHPPGERQAVAGIVADDAGDGICLEIDDDRQPGVVRWHAGNDAFLSRGPHRVESTDFYRVVPREQCMRLVVEDIC